MRAGLFAALISLTCAAGLSSKDKPGKVPFDQLVSGMQHAFNCGVVVEKYLHGTLKGKDDDYHTLRKENNCDYVESVLNAAPQEH